VPLCKPLWGVGLKYWGQCRKCAFTSGSSHSIYQQQKNADILSIQKDVIPETKGRHPAKDMKVVMDEKVVRSKQGVETPSLDT